MRISRDDEALLERWLCSLLERLEERNPESLAKYVISLLKQDMEPMDKLQKYCEDELKTFLKEKTAPLAKKLFAALQDGSYRTTQPQGRSQDRDDEEEDRDRRRRSMDEEDDYGSRRRNRDSRRDSDAQEPSSARKQISSRDDHRDHDRRRDSRDRDQGRDRNRDSREINRDGRDGRDGRGGRDSRDGRRDDNKRKFEESRHPRDASHRDRPQPHNGQQQSHHGNQPNRQDNRPAPKHAPEPWAQQGVFPPPFPGMVPPGAPFWPPGGYPQAFPPMPFGGPGFFYGAPGFGPVGPGGPELGPDGQPVVVDGSEGAGPMPPSVPRPMPPPGQPDVAADGAGEGGFEEQPQGEEQEASESAAAPLAATPAPRGPPALPSYMMGLNMGQHGMDMGYGYGRYDYGMLGMGQPAYQQQPMQQGNRQNNNHGNNNRRHSNGNGGGNGKQASNLPEAERCTLRCTGIPVYVKEEDIRAHFEAFGGIVELQISPMVEKDEKEKDKDDKKKVYNECLVQFYNAPNAKKCLSSPIPVLNNRFIHVYQSYFNIIPPSDVPPPTEEIMERDQTLLSQERINPSAPIASKPKASSGGLNIFQQGVSNKWRRTDTAKVPVVPVVAEVTEVTGESEGAAGDAPAAAPKPVEKPVEKAAEKKEDTELKETFVQLKSLSVQNETMLKKKETIITTQMDECRKMIDKLELQADSDSKTALLQKLEGKVLDLQGQLRTVREELNRPAGASSDKQSPPPKYMGRGRGGGYAARGYNAVYPARGYAGRGRGAFGRGRGPPGRGNAGNANPFAAANLDSQLAAVDEQLQRMAPEPDSEIY